MTDWTLFRGAEELGTLTLGDTDFPWYKGGFNATAEFEKVRPLFDELVESVNGGGGNFRDIWNRITEPGLYLQAIHDGKRYDKFIFAYTQWTISLAGALLRELTRNTVRFISLRLKRVNVGRRELSMDHSPHDARALNERKRALVGFTTAGAHC